MQRRRAIPARTCIRLKKGVDFSVRRTTSEVGTTLRREAGGSDEMNITALQLQSL